MRPLNVMSLLLLTAMVFAIEAAHSHDKLLPKTLNSPLSPQVSLRHLKVAPGLRLELVAAEPQVIDPVAIAFAEDGRMWVVEMTDYPDGPGENEAPRSRVRVLEDRDGDGIFESAHTFVDQLLFATGLQLWKDGVFITLAGKVMYFRDTTGDGTADLHETWFTGFAQGNEQLRANHPTLALDNHIYIANGLQNGTVVGRPGKDGTPASPVSISGRDFRFDPNTGHYDAVTGSGQFGLTFDNFGNRFVCTNRYPAKHIVLKQRYIDRNPLLAIRSATYDVFPTEDAAAIFPLSRNWTAYTEHAGQITAACGVLSYRGDALPEEYSENVFVCDPTGNLIHRRVLIPDGASFQSHRGREAVEFLASPDDWFRPVNLTIGPDGALYVVDMYRAVVEHPDWLPKQLSDRLPWDAGTDRGRIYRIVAADAARTGKHGAELHPVPNNLKTCPPNELVSLLEHPNAWWRETAARLLYERQDKRVRGNLQNMVRNGTSAAARVHALWLLDGLAQLAEEEVHAAVTDRSPRVREQATVLSERWLKTSPTLLRKVTELADDPDARVRFQVALSLGEAERDAEINTALQRIALDAGTDSWTRAAVLSSAGESSSEMLLEVLAGVNAHEDAGATSRLLKDLSHLVGARRQNADIRRTIKAILTLRSDSLPRPIQFSVLTELGRGVHWRAGSFADILDEMSQKVGSTGEHLAELLAGITEAANDRTQPVTFRRDCLELLRYVGFQRAGDTLIEIVQSNEPQELQQLAIDVLGSYDDPGIGGMLLVDFQSQTPAMRSVVLDAMLSDPGRTRLLLSEITSDNIALSELSPSTVQQLMQHPDTGIRADAKRLLADAIPASRQEIIAEYQVALSRKGDLVRGQAIFQKSCSECHRIGEIGFNVGPYIGDFTIKSSVRDNPGAILESILNPNRAIDASYLSYTIATNSGKVHAGLIAQETGSSVTLKQAKEKLLTILRNEIEEIRSNRTSLMPDGFEKNISVEQMADLIEFLRDWRFLDDQVPFKRGSSGRGTTQFRRTD